MPRIKRRKKEPLSKGFSSIIYKWFRCAMLTQVKSDIKKELDVKKSSSTSQVNYIYNN